MLKNFARNKVNNYNYASVCVMYRAPRYHSNAPFCMCVSCYLIFLADQREKELKKEQRLQEQELKRQQDAEKKAQLAREKEEKKKEREDAKKAKERQKHEREEQ